MPAPQSAESRRKGRNPLTIPPRCADHPDSRGWGFPDCVPQRSAGEYYGTFTSGNPFMNLHLAIGPVVALLAGILILVMPQLLNLIVAIYLIIVGVTGLLNKGTFGSRSP